MTNRALSSGIVLTLHQSLGQYRQCFLGRGPLRFLFSVVVTRTSAAYVPAPTISVLPETAWAQVSSPLESYMRAPSRKAET
jgi:hypothetical protein